MNLDKVANLAGAVIAVAMVTTIVAHPASAQVVKAFGSSFSSVLLAAQGKA